MAGGMRLQSAAADVGNGNEVNCFGHSGIYTLTVVAAGTTITAGELQWETSPTSGYAGLWTPIGAAITPVIDEVVSVSYEGPLNYVRCRITVAVAGTGTPVVTVRMQTPILGF
jgi:hypothetical protein